MEVQCLGCKLALPDPFLDLGSAPLVNSYLREEELPNTEETFHLAVSYCPHCHLVQLTELVPPEKLFSEYVYFSSFSDSFLEHARRMADALIARFSLSATSRVLEIASNDGYLLQFFRERGIPVLGVEPAANIAREAVKKGIPTVTTFFGPDAVGRVRSEFGTPDVIIGNNVLAHVPGINGFLDAVAKCLSPRGCAVFEFPHLVPLLDNTEFDTIYHEHVFYYSLAAICGLAERAGLECFDVERQDVHGGSLRVFLQHRGARPIEASVAALIAQERTAGVLSAERFSNFGRQVLALREKLIALLSDLKRQGKTVAAYGAPAKGNTLLNYCGIGTDLIEFTVDRSPHKQGQYLPGSHIPILAPEALSERRPDYALILAWNVADEIASQQQDYLRGGGHFIVPVPEPRIVSN